MSLAERLALSVDEAEPKAGCAPSRTRGRVKAVQDGADGDCCLTVGCVEEVSVGAKSDP